MKRRVILISVIIILALGAAAAYFLTLPPSPTRRSFFGNLPIIGGRAPLGVKPPAEEKEEGKIAPREEKVLIRQIVDQDILAPTISPDKKSLYYVLRENGHILKSDLDGNNEETLTNLTILESFDGFWSPLKTKAVIFYHESGMVKKFVEETATGTPSRFLPQEVQSFSWSPDGKSMAYLIPQGGQTNLVIADQDNKGGRVVFSTPIPDFTLQWVSKNSILLVSRPSGLAPSLVMRFDVVKRQAEPLLTASRGVVVRPMPDASGFAFSKSSASSQVEAMALYTFKDGRSAPLDIITIAEKCAFSPDSQKLYCGVPQGGVRSPSPDEWYKGAVAFSDAIVEIDLKNNQSKTLMENQADVDVISPFVSPDGQYLFFQDKKDGTLWRLTLE